MILGVSRRTDIPCYYSDWFFNKLADGYNLLIETCAEQIDLEEHGIKHGHCIDKKLIEKIINCKISGSKDKNQRQEYGKKHS